MERNRVYIVHGKRYKSLRALALEYEVKLPTLYARVNKKGQDAESAINELVKKRKQKGVENHSEEYNLLLKHITNLEVFVGYREERNYDKVMEQPIILYPNRFRRQEIAMKKMLESLQ